ncbi:MAG: ATPase, T2SS/T4P/T4SS family [Deferrisomatales bacterium]
MSDPHFGGPPRIEDPREEGARSPNPLEDAGPPLVRPDPAALDPEALALLPAELCRRYGVLPLHLAAEVPGGEPVLALAAAGPLSARSLADVTARAGRPVRLFAALREDLEAALDQLYGAAPAPDVGIREGGVSKDELDRILEDPTGSVLLRHLLQAAVTSGEGGLHLKMRAGELQAEDLTGRLLFAGGETWHTILLDRLRQLSGLGGRSEGILQRGRVSVPLAAEGAPSLFRVSILRGLEGEEAQVKLLRPQGRGRSFGELGATSHQVMLARRALEKPGLVWVTAAGEEGLGSTLFGLSREVPAATRTVTIEEEVFYRSPEFLQLETLELGPDGRAEVLRELKYLEFDRVVVDRVSPALLGELLALALRRRWVLAASPEASLRESLASLAVRAAELPLYGLRLVVHQRLVPLLCPACRTPCVLGSAETQALGRLLPGRGPYWQPGEGCPACGGRGVKGGRVYFEVLPVDAEVREALYGEARGERRLEGVLAGVQPAIRNQVAAAVAAGEVGLSEFWDVS